MLTQEQDWHSCKRVLIVKTEVNSSVQILFDKDSKGKPYAYIWALWVNPQHRKKGIGGELLQAAEKYCTEHGYKTAYLEWSKAEDNTPYWVFEWYIRHGWNSYEFCMDYAKLRKELR